MRHEAASAIAQQAGGCFVVKVRPPVSPSVGLASSPLRQRDGTSKLMFRALCVCAPLALTRRPRRFEVSEDDCGCAATPIRGAKMLVFDKTKIGKPLPVHVE